ncbi:unnamed protein product [Laminaria digitata]
MKTNVAREETMPDSLGFQKSPPTSVNSKVPHVKEVYTMIDVERSGTVIICRLRRAEFQKSSLAEAGGGVRSFAGDRDDCCVGGAWHARAVFGSSMALESGRCWKSIVIMFSIRQCTAFVNHKK